MTEEEAISRLATLYRLATSHKEKVVAVHPFGLRHARELDGFDGDSLKRIAFSATGSGNYATELRKMRNLANYVTIADPPVWWPS